MTGKADRQGGGYLSKEKDAKTKELKSPGEAEWTHWTWEVGSPVFSM
jgi:hypothetical protein